MQKPQFFRDIYNDTFRVIGENIVLLSKALLLPVIVIIGFEYFIPEDAPPWVALSTLPFYLAAAVAFAVAIHRIVLLGDDSLPEWGVLVSWSKRETRFLGYYLLIGSIIASVYLPMLVPGIGMGTKAVVMLFWLIFAVFVAARFSLALPALATDKPITLKQAWNRSLDHKGLLVAVFIVFTFIFHSILSLVPETPLREHFLEPVVSIINLLFSVTALSLAYSAIERYRNPPHEEKPSENETLPWQDGSLEG